eukprot:m.22879 g.22879  ORF g.22879 m.22879 type:complete len:225 (-) comp4038_c0_seq1:50-724(-)
MAVASEEWISTWRNVTSVCFDVDSTVCTDEAIDKLAEFCGVKDEVVAWTKKAMDGSVLFQDAFAARMGIISPTLEQFEKCAAMEPHLTPGIKDLVAKLHSRGVAVFLVSGGFQRLIEPVAERLGIPADRIFANVLNFDGAGKYVGHDTDQPTSRSGGKREVVELLKQQPEHKVLAMIGDGATDMEAKPPADLFIGFGGNVVRDKVKQGADVFVMDFQRLIDALD